ncbi:Nitrate/nitrite transporter [Pseudomonas sp. R4-34-07]|nr:Nitrate/nitrite transporter [Pseudomonas sp. R4-34-07]
MTYDNQSNSAPLDDAEGERLMRRILWRVVPFIFICYVISYLDRTNVGFAAISMNKDLGLTATMFGWAAGLFFFGYFIFEIPSNLLMQRFGARIWIARIMITWGLISMATAFATGPISFSIARFLLGVAEAGFTPGVYLYFTYWFPGKWRAKATATFLLGIPVANIVGSPLSGWLLEQHGVLGLQNWQLLLITEALPAVLLGIACLFLLVDTPLKARWLSDREKTWLNNRLSEEQKAIGASHGNTLRAALTNPKVFTLAAINFCCIVGSVGIGIWLPQIIKSLGISSGALGFVVALPYVVGAIAGSCKAVGHRVVIHQRDVRGVDEQRTGFRPCNLGNNDQITGMRRQQASPARTAQCRMPKGSQARNSPPPGTSAMACRPLCG